MKFIVPSLKWLLFSVEIVVLGLLLIVAFLVPVDSGDSKIPTIIALAAWSFVPAFASAICFTIGKYPRRWKDIFVAPPMIVFAVVVGLTATPLLIGWVFGERPK